MVPTVHVLMNQSIRRRLALVLVLVQVSNSRWKEAWQGQERSERWVREEEGEQALERVPSLEQTQEVVAAG